MSFFDNLDETAPHPNEKDRELPDESDSEFGDDCKTECY